MIETIILAGGFGTRLKAVVPDLPKPMAPVAGVPFLTYLFKYLKKYNVETVHLSVGYLAEEIQDFFDCCYEDIYIKYFHEEEPLGTGGAIAFGVRYSYSRNEHVLVLNGDSFFDVDIKAMYDTHLKTCSDITIALRKVDNTERYGRVETDASGRIIRYLEKSQSSGEGYINGGVYIIKKEFFKKNEFPFSFSFEKEILEKMHDKAIFQGFFSDGYFIDIGIPEDYYRAQNELPSFFK